MRKIFTVIFLALGLSFITGVSADQSPESIVTCSTGNAYDVGALSIAGAVNTESCTLHENTCATCITSLEDQGCKVIDVVVEPTRFEGYGDFITVTYLLSCVRP